MPATLSPEGIGVWRDRIASALRRLGYSDTSVEPVQGGIVADIAFWRSVVEIAPSPLWATALGRVLLDAAVFKLEPVVVLVGDSRDISLVGNVSNLSMAAATNLPVVRVWTLDTSTAVLDMGTGRAVTV